MQIEMGTFDLVKQNRSCKGECAQALREFAATNEPMMKMTFETDSDFTKGRNAILAAINRNSEFSRFKVKKRGLILYVIKEG